jgi:hypothetical protein
MELAMVRVDVEIHTDEEYDRVKEFVRTMPGWVQMDIEGDESDFEGGDPLAQFIVWFDNEKNAMWFKLQIG